MILLIGIAAYPASAQDGKLLDSSLVTLKGISERPQLSTILDSVDVKAITYLSDGLKVKGYLASPKTGAKLPCVILNRGGNREFGAITDEFAVALLGRVASWGYGLLVTSDSGHTP